VNRSDHLYGGAPVRIKTVPHAGRPELARPKSLVFSYRERAIGTGISVALPIGAGSFDPRSAKVDPAALAHVVRIIAITALTTGEPSGISMGITVLLLLLFELTMDRFSVPLSHQLASFLLR
jgi:hypothetical protein